ncbi:major facilitator superfamily domain-containing protein [Trametes maxima]|nr:major facilitator superfamily domain-containing protein [Trametes maxima]
MSTSYGTHTTLSDNSRSDLIEKHDDDPPPPPAPPPGRRPLAWLTVAGAWMVQFSTFGYVRLTNPPNTLIYPSWIGSVQLFLMYAPAVLVGTAFDAGYFHYVQIAGSLLLVLSIFMLSLVQPNAYYQVFLAQGLGIGLSVGLLFLPSLSIVAHHFSLRAAAHSPPASSGAIVAALLLLANCLMRTRLPPKHRRAIFTREGLTRIAHDGAYLWSIAGAFCTNLGLFVPFFYLQLFSADHAVAPAITTYILAILNGGSTLGRILPLALADALSVGVYTMLLPAILTSAALVFALFGATNTGGVVTVAALFGFSSGACTLRMGLAFSLVGTSMLVGTPIFGALLAPPRAGRALVWKALVFAGVCIVAGFACMAVSRTLFLRRRRARVRSGAPSA